METIKSYNLPQLSSIVITFVEARARLIIFRRG